MALTILPCWSARCGEPDSPHVMVIADDRQIAEAGLRVLLAGGSAADAAVAALMVMSVVEPQAAGIGGGAVLVHYDAATHTVTAWDGRETAPAAAIPSLPGEPRRSGGRAVGVPGAVRMLEALHHERGHLPWADLVAPAIRLAEQGALVSRDLAGAIATEQDSLRRQQAALGVFFAPDGAKLATGATLTNAPLAQTLRAIAAGGANGLLRGPIAAEIATAARGDEKAGLLTTDDLAAYLPRHRDATCAPYRWGNICTTPPPAGGIILLQMLGLLDHTDLASQDPDGVDAAALLIEAEQLAIADSAQYLADPDFVPVPVAGMLAEAYLAMRAHLIDRLHAIKAAPGAPLATPLKSEAKPVAEHGTSSVAIIDAQGNAIAMTATLGGPFGSHLFVRGFLLNAALADFAAALADPADPPAANQIQAGKRPATALAPAIVLDGDHRLVAVIGSTGGSRIPAYEAQALAGLLAWHMDAAHALAQPHIAGDPGAAVLEADTPAAALAPALTGRGFAAAVSDMPSRTILFALVPQAQPGAADPRGQGEAAGQ
jgi:gamma-glutamyltranspeptidase/glutathione hydrolase